MHFHIQWSYVGFVYWDEQLNIRQNAAAIVGGPLMSLLLALLFGLMTYIIPQNELRTLFGWTATFNCIQFVITIIPITYPRWMGRYSGLPSDGLQLRQILKK